MTMLASACCPICGTGLTYVSNLERHLKDIHANKQVGYSQLEAFIVNTLVVDKSGTVFQKMFTTERSWCFAGNEDAYSSWWLLHNVQPIYQVVGNTTS